MKDDCYAGNGYYKCDTCAFARKDNLRCANPNIYETPPRDAYFKSHDAVLNKKEREMIIKFFDEE